MNAQIARGGSIEYHGKSTSFLGGHSRPINGHFGGHLTGHLSGPFSGGKKHKHKMSLFELILMGTAILYLFLLA
jgi:hypothetical protein